MRCKFLSVVLCIALLISFTSPTDVTAQEDVQTLRLGLIFPINQLDPLFTENSSEAVIAEQLFLGLVRLDENDNPIPELAEGWEISDDGLIWTFYLRQDIPWVASDRIQVRDVIAEDVAYTLDRARRFGNFEELIAGVEVVDDYTVTIFLRAPAPDFLTMLAVSLAAKVLPSDQLQAYGDGYGWTEPGVIWSDGSYLLVDQTHTSVVLETNPFWVDEVNFPVRSAQVEYTPNNEEALQRYLRGEFDMIELHPDIGEIVMQEPGLAEQVHLTDAATIDLYSQMPLAGIAGIGHGYLVKPYLLPAFSGYYGLARFVHWEFDTQPPEVQIPGTTRVLNDETLGALQSMTEDQSGLVFERMTPQLSLIFAGDIIVGGSTLDVGTDAAPYGFLRRVVSTFSQSSGQFVIETAPAALEEAIQNGGQSAPIPIDFVGIYREEVLAVSALPQRGGVSPVGYKPPYTGLKVDIDHVIYDDDGDTNTEDDQVRAHGWVNVEPGAEVQLDFDIRNHRLQSFHFLTISEESAEVELYSSVDVLAFEKVVPIKRYTFMPATFFIGPVPVVITPQLTVYVGANGKVSVKFSTGVEQSATIITGATYENGGWHPITEISDNHIGKLETKLEQAAKAGAFAGPELSVKVYGAAGPYGRIKGYLALSADPSADPWWKLTGGVNGDLGMKVEVFSFAVVSYTVTITILPEQVLDQAGGGITPPTVTPPVVTPTSTPPPCPSIWWPPGCWTWWIWVIVVIVAIFVLAAVFG